MGSSVFKHIASHVEERGRIEIPQQVRFPRDLQLVDHRNGCRRTNHTQLRLAVGLRENENLPIKHGGIEISRCALSPVILLKALERGSAFQLLPERIEYLDPGSL